MAKTKKAKISELKKKIKELTDQKTKLELGEFDVDLQKLLTEAAAFGIKSFGWHQYTPYFNDGDECTFGVYCDEDYVNINGEGEYYDDEDEEEDDDQDLDDDEDLDDDVEEVKKPVVSKENRKKWPALAKRFAKLVNSCDEETLEERFGDHVEITVSLKKGKVHFKVEEYEHD